MQTLKPKSTQTCDSSLHLHIHTDRNREAMKERERRRGNGERSREREMETEGGDEAWDTERETEKRKRQNTITVRFSTAIRSLARLRTPKPQAHTGISVQAIYLPSSDRRNCHRLFFSPFLYLGI